MAARLSAESPSRNAATRAGRGSCSTRSNGLARRAMVVLLRKRERSLIEIAARQSGGKRHFAHGILERNARQRLAQQRFGVISARLLLRGRWRDDEHDLTAQFAPCSISSRQRFEVAAPHFFVQLGKFAAQCGFTRSKSGGKVGECRCDPRSGFKKHQRGRNAGKLSDARSPGCLFGRQKAREKELIGRQAGDRE